MKIKNIVFREPIQFRIKSGSRTELRASVRFSSGGGISFYAKESWVEVSHYDKNCNPVTNVVPWAMVKTAELAELEPNDGSEGVEDPPGGAARAGAKKSTLV